MDPYESIGKSPLRKDGRDKVRGKIKYVNDMSTIGTLHAVLKTSPFAHAKITSIDTSQATKMPGVRKVVTGEDIPFVVGLYLGDKYPLAVKKVRHYGEPVVAVIADSKEEALAASDQVKVSYEQLPIIRNVDAALTKDAPLVHEELDIYQHIDGIYPENGSNVANRTKIRKGNIDKGFEESTIVVEDTFSFPMGDHGAMETRAANVEIREDGQVLVTSTTQAPFLVKDLMSNFFDLEPGKITVTAPPIGGGFGGKAGIQLEGLTYLLSKSVGGRPVRLVNTREQDLTASPGRIGMKGKIKLGCSKDGEIKAMEMIYMFDSGAYADYSVNISRAAAIACTGPYRVENVKCDSLCVYTNHPLTNAYRGFGHMELAFVVERALDIMAEKLNMDSSDLRRKNIIKIGDTTPTQRPMDENTGDLEKCIDRVKELVNWEEGVYLPQEGNRIRAKGMACFWKAPAMPVNTGAGAIITFNEDGSMNLHCGVVEIGQGTQTGLAQILAEKFKMSVDKIQVVTEINTKVAPNDWATVASRGLFMAGRATLDAAEDALTQIKRTASIALRVPPEDLDVANEKVFLRDEPHVFIPLKDVVRGYVYANGNAIEGQVIGRGRYVSRKLTGIDKETGKGRPDLEWTLGAEVVEVELNLDDYSYKILKSACVMDGGKIIHPDLARGQVAGAMGMGLSFASSEAFQFNSREQVMNDDLRTFKIMRYGEEPEYLIDFIETPQGDGPYGLRGIGEQGIIGIPAAMINALSRAIGVQLKELPLTPENLWRAKEGQQ